MDGKKLSIALVIIGLLLGTAAVLWWTIYYARAAQATRSYREGLAPLAICLVITTERCRSLETGTEYPAPSTFLANEDETAITYLQELAAPDGIARYQPWLAWIALLLLVGGLGIAVARPDVSYATFANSGSFVGYLFVLPSLIGFVVFFLYPAIGALQISFHEWNLLRPPKFVGLENFQDLLSDRRFWRSLRVTLFYVVLNIPIQTVLALFLAVVLDRFSNALSSFVRGLMVLPWLLPQIVVGLLWLWLLDPLLGLVNALIGVFGIPPQPFLGSPQQVIPAIAGINIWQFTGYTAILFYAGLKTIPRELYHAASIDGANQWQQFWRITMPLLRPVTIFVLVTSIIGSFQVFDTVAITTGAGSTGGGPAGASSVILFYIFDKIFNRGFDMGLAAAASVALFVILVTVSIIQLQFLRAGESDLAEYS